MALYLKLILIALKWLRLPIAEQWYIFKIALLFGIVRLGMFVFSLRQLQLAAGRFAALPCSTSRCEPDERKRILWATSRLGAHFLADRSCLTEALTVQLLFWRRGYPADLRIGVAKQQNGKLIAHAWVESDGKVVIGNIDELSSYVMLPEILNRECPQHQ
jgi:hypothetical protein